MATIGSFQEDNLLYKDLEHVKRLLWGDEIKHDVFRRWLQGFVFGEDEPSALLQFEGGPCAVIAPLQSFLLKNIIFTDINQTGNKWREVTDEDRNNALCQALFDMLTSVATQDCIVVCHQSFVESSSSATPKHKQATPPSQQMDGGSATDSTVASGSGQGSTASGSESCVPAAEDEDKSGGNSSPKKKCFSHEEFHSGLRCHKCSPNDLMNHLREMLPAYHSEYGVLMFLYSVILSKGIDQIKNELEDPGLPLIDGVYGHGSQSLINLLISGRAVSNVWDNDKDLGGLKLQGINKQSTIGFLTLLEHLRYCEVGWYLKNPRFPIWILGSETHLTVLFSQDRNLVSVESPEAEARRIFNSFDTEGSGFVSADLLGDLLGALNLVSEPEYVTIMRDKLDPEQLGIITLSGFMDEFFPCEQVADAVHSFTLYHYNGLSRSCPQKKVSFAEGSAVIMDSPELQIITDASPIKTCLMTKWPTIELKWSNDHIPSMN